MPIVAYIEQQALNFRKQIAAWLGGQIVLIHVHVLLATRSVPSVHLAMPNSVHHLINPRHACAARVTVLGL